MSHYIGRFAPSPTGPLHMGSLIGALASFLDARATGGRWLLRMEDLDPPREVAGAAQAILATLQAHGLYWDAELVWQSRRHAAYRQAVQRLLERGRAFYCSCSRSDLQASGGIHRGRCEPRSTAPGQPYAVRLAVSDEVIEFDDGVQGHYRQSLMEEVGDFVLLRKDGLFAYQLAVVVDDAAAGVNQVVRGSDLLDSTPRQIFLQRQLGLPTPAYTHVPVIVNSDGQKLSKQSFAQALNVDQAEASLRYALAFLGQPAPPANLPLPDLLAWSVSHWQRAQVPALLSRSEGFAS